MTALYRLYSADGVLLYVGIADNVLNRLKQHSKDKPWWPHVATTTHQTFPARADAEAAEKRAIRTERPVHNVVHNRQQPPATFVERHINWTCELCSSPIRLNDKEPGYLQISAAEAQRWGSETREWKAAHPYGLNHPYDDDLAAACTMPRRMHWEHICKSCDTARDAQREAMGLEADGGHYWVDLCRVKTPGNFLEWTAHVMAKRWVRDDTDWLDLTAKVAGWLGSRGC
jgi:predicted GIY-YIG superfamily endonuclease